jgi:hypothetical protein
MAGPIGMAVARGLKVVVCPHCKARQARARNLRGPITCKKCKKQFDPAAKPKKR